MKIKQLFLPLVGALALIGCNKDAAEPTESGSTKSKPVTLSLSMEATVEATDEVRAILFDTSKNIPPTAGNTDPEWTTHCFLSCGAKRAYATIKWEVTNSTPGQIKLKMKGHTLTLEQSGSQPLVQPQPGERWVITGITGGGEVKENNTRVEFAPTNAYDGLTPNQAQVPFIFGPLGFNVASEGMRAPWIMVKLKPQGSLLNVYVNNATNRGKHAVSTDLKLYTNALSNNGYYDYSTGELQWKFTNESAQEEVISRPITVDKDADAKYVLWGMPRPETAKPSEGFKSEIYLGRYKIFAEGSTTAKPKVRQVGFTNGLAYPMGINIDRPFMPLEYVAEYNVAEDRASFATTHDAGGDKPDDRGEYFTFDEAKQLFRQIKIAGKHYHLPNINEGASVAPIQMPTIIPVIQANSGVLPLGHKETASNRSFQIENKLYEGYQEQVHYAEKRVHYALRFINDAKDMLMAYRYTFVIDFAQPNKGHVVITSRYIGPNNVSLDDISTADYWNNNNEDDAEVTYSIVSMWVRPVSSSNNPGFVKEGLNKFGNYWLDCPDEMPRENQYFFQMGVLEPENSTSNFRVIHLSPKQGNMVEGMLYYYPVRLFSDRVY